MPAKRSQQNASASRTSAGPSDRNGTLYVVAVSMGHPDDVTMRAVRILGEVDIIASEDPKLTQQLLLHHDIRATVTSYGPRNLREKAAVLLHRLQQGHNVALVSDCGSPLVADPGYFLVAAAHRRGIPVVPVPGPSAVTAALMAAGFLCDSFNFLGHLPKSPSRLTRCLNDALSRKDPTVAFCTGAMVERTITTLCGLSPRCSVAVAYDLTKPNERIIRGAACEVREKLCPAQGRDITLVLAGKNGTKSDDQVTGGAQSLSSRRIKIR